MSLYVPFIAVLILVISLCYDAPHTGFKFCIVSCPFRQTIKTRSLKVRINSKKVMKPVPIILPEKKGALHLFFITSLICINSLGGLNPTPLPPCGEHNTSKISRRKTFFQIFRIGDVEKYSTLDYVSKKESIIFHWTTVVFVYFTSNPCSVCTPLNFLLGGVFLVCW